ncbi:vacuolar protein sorting protein [Diplodia corticola]|uniref:Vacuolar protein-sorting-associated protein 36 n=1 Tax=Diplodia corticola TaxID=236234 RepID=A0A1J9RB57_9PEZI|nr:vacuolar protein sorting protein [Diplodia corticola]OJD37378.1 vacuolar protein sorting protein [Diplodia corticola]
MFIHRLDLTTALRPELLPDEALLFVQDAVGLYEGKYKIPDYQDGHAYLTSHRVCYVDNKEPRKSSVAVSLKDVERPEFYAGFLKSSPKVTVYPKPNKRPNLAATRGPVPISGSSAGYSPASTPPRHGSPLRPLPTTPAPPPSASATWVCPICSFSNPVPSNFDPALANTNTPLPPCLACGLKPPLVHLIKAAIAANRQVQAELPGSQRASECPSTPASARITGSSPSAAAFQCPRCTFQNHPSLLSCEMCGASLVNAVNKRTDINHSPIHRNESPAPVLSGAPIGDDIPECIKFSFRAGGGPIFFERLKGALLQRKWLLQSAPPIPRPIESSTPSQSPGDLPIRNKAVGIGGLERRGIEQRQNNEIMIGSAFEDLEALMTSAKEIIALAEQFASQANLNGNGNSEADAALAQSASALGLVTTKDMLGSGSDTLYISELSRNLAEFLTDDRKGILKREGGIMSLVDLWAVFNRARGGVELVSPTDFEKAAQMWDKLRLPIRLRRFKSGLLVVQGRDRTDEKTIASLLSWLQELHTAAPPGEAGWDWETYGRGVTAQEAAEWFGWSVGVATEELEMAEEKGVLCREQGLDGIKFWENWIVKLPRVEDIVVEE